MSDPKDLFAEDERRVLRDLEGLGDGVADGLEPLQTLDLGQIGDADELLRAMSHTAFNGRRAGEAADVLEAMVRDPDCAVVLTLSGAMTVAKMGLVITEMIERGWVQAVVSTGALMTHGMVELAGLSHYKHRPDLDDKALFEKGYNRVYDTIELETSLVTISHLVVRAFEELADQPIGSWQLLRKVGELLQPLGQRGVLTAAYAHGVPIYIPAFSDSEMGLDFVTVSLERLLKQGLTVDEAMAQARTNFDPFLDLCHFTRFVMRAPRLGLFTIGGGVPRNWAQQSGPFVDYVNNATGSEVPLNRYRYAARICPEPVHWGGLSGCTYSEGISWGKFVPPEEGGRFAEVYADATLIWPLIVQGVAQRLKKDGVAAASPTIDLEGFRPA